MSFAKVAKSDVAVQTQCSNCFDSIKSRWTWKHPGPGKLHTLVPQTGHGSCGRQPGKTKMPLAGCRGFSANKWQCRGTGFLCSRATNRELQTLWRSSYLSSQSSQVSMFKLQGAKLWSTVGDGSKSSIQHYAFESSQAATPRTSEHVGKCYRAPSASIGSAEEWLKEVWEAVKFLGSVHYVHSKNRTCRRALEHIGTQELLHLIITGEEKLPRPSAKRKWVATPCVDWFVVVSVGFTARLWSHCICPHRN